GLYSAGQGELKSPDPGESYEKPGHASGKRSAHCSALVTSSGVLTLKNGSSGSVGHSATASGYRALHSPTLWAFSWVRACRRASRSPRGQSPTTGCCRPADVAHASAAPA